MGKHAGRQYPDLRYMFIRALQQYEIYQHSRTYLKSASEWTSRAIVSLDLAEKPVKTAKQAIQLEGIGGEISKRLKDFETTELHSKAPPLPGRYISSASAILVAMLKARENIQAEEMTQDDRILIPESVIRNEARKICDEPFLHVEATDPDQALCPAWWRINVLAARGMVKKRQLNRETVYQLLPLGEEAAVRLHGQGKDVPKPPRAAVPRAPRSASNKSTQNRNKVTPAALNKAEEIAETVKYTNDLGADGVILLVDTQEWGGDSVGLAELVRLVEMQNLTYQTKKLACGDYSWVWRCAGMERTLPLLVERKRADDLAHSLKDNRYHRQKAKMLEWREKFRAHHIDAVLKYVVEDDPKRYAVRCADRCGAVVRCGYPTVRQLEVVIEELDGSADFELVRTDNIAATVDLLAIMTTELKHRLSLGDFDRLLTEDPLSLPPPQTPTLMDVEEIRPDVVTSPKRKRTTDSSPIKRQHNVPSTDSRKHYYKDPCRTPPKKHEGWEVDVGDIVLAPLVQYHNSGTEVIPVRSFCPSTSASHQDNVIDNSGVIPEEDSQPVEVILDQYPRRDTVPDKSATVYNNGVNTKPQYLHSSRRQFADQSPDKFSLQDSRPSISYTNIESEPKLFTPALKLSLDIKPELISSGSPSRTSRYKNKFLPSLDSDDSECEDNTIDYSFSKSSKPCCSRKFLSSLPCSRASVHTTATHNAAFSSPPKLRLTPQPDNITTKDKVSPLNRSRVYKMKLKNNVLADSCPIQLSSQSPVKRGLHDVEHSDDDDLDSIGLPGCVLSVSDKQICVKEKNNNLLRDSLPDLDSDNEESGQDSIITQIGGSVGETNVTSNSLTKDIDKYKHEFETVHSILPAASEARIRQVLKELEGNLDSTVAILLDETHSL